VTRAARSFNASPDPAMGTRDPRVDAYIDRSPEFARPILTHLRELVHRGCPEVEETMKWSFPHFMHQGMLCSMASFKQHCAFGFWKGSLIVDDAGRSTDAAGQFGKLTSMADLPPDDTLLGYLREAVRMNEQGVKVEKKPKPAKPELVVPGDLGQALDANPAARSHFDAFSPSKRRDYVEWITEAKSAATREKRLAQAVEWIGEGKARNWKYENC
jgi:uncharacterized protein YdeI (YjbR/CyaY-like superfamily)